jgi:hypothetical protein
VAALAAQAVVGQNLLQRFAIAHRLELVIAERRAHLHRADAEVREDLRQTGEIALFDHRAMGIGLTADGQSQGAGVEHCGDVRHEQAGGRRIQAHSFEEFASRALHGSRLGHILAHTPGSSKYADRESP